MKKFLRDTFVRDYKKEPMTEAEEKADDKHTAIAQVALGVGLTVAAPQVALGLGAVWLAKKLFEAPKPAPKTVPHEPKPEPWTPRPPRSYQDIRGNWRTVRNPTRSSDQVLEEDPACDWECKIFMKSGDVHYKTVSARSNKEARAKAKAAFADAKLIRRVDCSVSQAEWASSRGISSYRSRVGWKDYNR